ncbi:acetyl esterase [Psychromicrobium silvestre]|uniref:Acetyl esterase n=1 Tax=Psychromicrobium silvestre TaxID=1645614 RepID=A0A7Y9LUM5_9MICC|nr:alpha/beta hydrolase [Psychromicrobium silvestre]NYE95906.1 acetyl esterase [Psychromicrobium silvestre]
MKIDPQLVPVLAPLTQAISSNVSIDVVAERAAEVSQSRGMVGTLTRAIPESVTWVDLETDGNHPVPIRVFTPVKSTEAIDRAALVYAHGGAWRTGSPDTVHEHTGNLAADADVVVISIDYRLIPENPYPAGLDDVTEVLRWVVEHAVELRVDPQRIAVGGSSAGGNLAAALALRARDHGGPAIALQLLEAPALDLACDSPSWDECRQDIPPLAEMLDRGLGKYRLAGADPKDPYASPLSAASFENLPPAHLLVGEADPLRSDSVRYAEALGAAGVRVSLQIFPGIVHGTENFVELLPTAAQWHRACVAALRSLTPTDDANTGTVQGA